MHRNIRLFAAFFILFLSMCTFYDQSGAIIAPNGLSCQNLTRYDSVQGQRSADCYYPCPDGTGRQVEIDGEFSAASPLYSASQEEVNKQFCENPNLPVLTQPPATNAPPTSPATAEATEEISLIPSATDEIILSDQPLLRGDVTMCDVGINLINFRMVEPAPDLTLEGLEVQIDNLPTTCSVNPTNTSLLTCTIPAGVTFPARVFVQLDGAAVNDFVYDGLGCAKIATAFPSTTP
jgi:hypothetical protein